MPSLRHLIPWLGLIIDTMVFSATVVFLRNSEFSKLQALGVALSVVFTIDLISLQTTKILRIRRDRRKVEKWKARNSSGRKVHTYQPLASTKVDTIRLIELLPSANKDRRTVCINLQPAPLLSKGRQQYEAISYCWGDSKDRLPVICCSSNSVIWVTKSLYDALRQFRLKDQPRWLWADAVCIDQSDTDEKTLQVRMMSDIYRNASRVLVWLGDKAQGSDCLDDFIPRLLVAKDLKEAAQNSKAYSEMEPEERNDLRIPPISGPSNDYSRYRALRRLIERPWFRRVWIIQEVALAREAILHCGDWEMPVKSLTQAWTFYTELCIGVGFSSSLHEACAINLSGLALTLDDISEDKQLPLLQLLTTHDGAQASDPRDKVFALHGLVRDAGGIKIDYHKSMSEVFQDTAIGIMAQNWNLDILSQACVRLKPSDFKQPSWVPDWCFKGTAGALVPTELHGLGFQATSGSSYNPALSQDGSRIRVSGYELDLIEQVGELTGSYGTTASGWKIWQWNRDLFAVANWAKICGAFDGKPYGPTGEPMIDVFRQTLLYGCPKFRSDLQSEEDALLMMLNFERWIRFFGFWDSMWILRPWKPLRVISSLIALIINMWIVFVDDDWSRPMASYFVYLIVSTCSGRRLIITSQGHIGLSAGDVRAHDKVVMLEGANVPYILRKKAEKDVYELTGEAFLYECMDGERWDQGRCHPMWLV